MQGKGKCTVNKGFIELKGLGASLKRSSNSNLRLFISVLTALILLLTIAPETNAIMFEINMEDLSSNSDLFIVGTVKSMESQWNEDKTNIYTTVSLSVDHVINGHLKSKDVEIVVPGGEVDGISETVLNAPDFKLGEQALLFLKEQPGQDGITAQNQVNSYQVYGNFQGKIEVNEGNVGDISIKQLEENPGILNDLEIEHPDAESIGSLNDTTLVVSSSHQFVDNGRRWPGNFPVVDYHVNALTEHDDHIQLAANTWNDAGANFAFEYAGTHSREGKAAFNHKNEVIWHEIEGNILAITTVWSAGPDIVETDIVFNSLFNWSTDDVSKNSYYDVQTVALHELGHSLGLGHPDIKESAMYYEYKGIQRHLYEIDLEGIQYLYGLADNASNIINDDHEEANPFIETLQVIEEELAPDFDPEVSDYELTVDNNLNTISLNIVLPDGNYLLSVDGKKVNNNKEVTVILNAPGTETVIEIVVACENSNTEKTYIISVNRKQAPETPAWQHISDDLVHSMAFNEGILASSIVDQGVFLYDGTNWEKIVPLAAQELAYSGDILAASFEDFGIWKYQSGSWNNITPVTAQTLASDGDTLAVSFEDFGLWKYQSDSWKNITPVTAQTLAYDNGALVASFSDFGTWLYENGSWTQVNALPAEVLAYDNEVLAASFSDFGTWLYEDGNWTQVNTLPAEVLAYDSGILAGSFPGHGVYLYDGVWEQISNETAQKLAFKDGVLAGSFPGNSIYLYK